MIGNIGPLEIGVVLIIALLVFGPRRLPELGGSLGKGIREFTQSVSGRAEEKPALPQGEATVKDAAAPAAEPAVAAAPPSVGGAAS